MYNYVCTKENALRKGKSKFSQAEGKLKTVLIRPCETPKPHTIKKPSLLDLLQIVLLHAFFFCRSLCSPGDSQCTSRLCQFLVLENILLSLSCLCSYLDFKGENFLNCIRKGYFLQKSHCCQEFITPRVTFPWLSLGCNSSAQS